MSELKLPPLQQTEFDAELTQSLFRDLAACTRVLSVTPKYTAAGHTTGTLSLSAAESGLADQSIRAVQIRYLYENQEWCDTLMRTPRGVRVIRINTNDIANTVAPSA